MNELTAASFFGLSTAKENAIAFVDCVDKSISSIKNNFFEIGGYLFHARKEKLYTALGYKTIEDCAEKYFDIKKSTCYDLISVFEKFNNPSRDDISIALPAAELRQSQLVEAARAKAYHLEFAKIIKPIDTVKDVAVAVKIWNKQCNSASPFIKGMPDSLYELHSMYGNKGYEQETLGDVVESLSQILQTSGKYDANAECAKWFSELHGKKDLSKLIRSTLSQFLEKIDLLPGSELRNKFTEIILILRDIIDTYKVN